MARYSQRCWDCYGRATHPDDELTKLRSLVSKLTSIIITLAINSLQIAQVVKKKKKKQ